MTTLVTGANGFVGSAVVRALLARGETVRALVRPGGDRRNLAGLGVDLAIGDLRERASVEAACRGCAAVYHVAADYRLWTRTPRKLYRVNVDGTRDLVRSAAAAGARRIVYTSSVATLGTFRDGRPADEETPVAFADMVGDYKRSKYLAEDEVRRLVAEEGAPVVLVNPSTPIGPRDVRPTPTGRIVLEAARGRMPAFVETGLNVVHVDDVAEGHLLAFDRGAVGERYVLGGHDLTFGALLALVAEAAGRRAPRVRLPHGFVLPFAYASEAAARLTGKEPFATVAGVRMARKHMYFSSAKAQRVLGYRARPPREAVADALAWFRENGYL